LLLASSDPSLAALLPRVILSMAVVIALMWLAARALERRSSGTTKSRGVRLSSSAKRTIGLQVVARQALGRRASVSIVRAGDKALVIGVTDQQISLLAELDEVDLETPEADTHRTGAPQDALADAPGTAWKGLLTQVRERTVRKA